MKKTLFLAFTLLASSAMASIYDLSNCNESDYTRAQKIVQEAKNGVAQGIRTKAELAMSEVYSAEVGLCSSKLSKPDACNAMIRNQEIVTGVGVNLGEQGTTELTYVAGNGTAGKLDELRRLASIKAFCGK